MTRVLVTGASAGIGEVVARRLVADGAEVVAVARRRPRVPGAENRSLDVADPAAWAAADLDDVAGVVCAAGVLGPIGAVGTYDAAAFAEVLAVNVTGTLLAVQACLPGLRATRGAVVTFSGGGATGPLAHFDAYAASKAAVVRLTENLAAGLADAGIRLNAVAPGFVATGMHDATIAAGPQRAGADYHARTQRDLAAGGVPPELAAELVAFLLSDAAAGISGKLLSAPWDPWRDPAFRARLRAEPDLATLRRIDDQFFTRIT